MFGFLLHTSDGQTTIQHMDVSHEDAALPTPPDGYVWTPCPAPSVDYVAQPDGQGGFVVVPVVIPDDVQLAQAKDARTQEATDFRDGVIGRGVATSFGRADADEASRVNVAGAVQMAMLAEQAYSAWQTAHSAWEARETARGGTDPSDPEPVEPPAFSVQWRMFDNSYVTLNAAQMMQFGQEVGVGVDAIYQASFVIKNAIAAAASVTDVNAIDVTAGYP